MGNLNKQKLIHDKDKYMDELVNDTVSFLIEQMSLKHYRDIYLYCDDYYKKYGLGTWKEHCFKPQEKIKY